MLWQLTACPHTRQSSYLPVPDVEYHVVLVAHGHNVLHIGGEGHTGHAILVAQHLCHLTLLIHIPDAYSRPMPVLGNAGPLLLIGSAPGRARRAFRAEIVVAPGCVQKPPPPSTTGLSGPGRSCSRDLPGLLVGRRNGPKVPPHPLNHHHNSPPPSLCTSHQERRPEHSETSWG